MLVQRGACVCVGVISHQQERNIINGKKQIILNPPENQKNYERFDFEEGETWTIDIIVSSGEGKVIFDSARVS